MLAVAALFCLPSAGKDNGQQKKGGNAPSHLVGILPFEDLSGEENGTQLKDVLAKKLQAGLLSNASVTPKFMKPGGEEGGDTAIDVPYAIKLARYYKTDLAIMGALISAETESSDNSFSGPTIGGISFSGKGMSQSATVVLQAQIIDVGRGEVLATFRVTGKNKQTKVAPDVGSDYGSFDLSGGEFGHSALGKATESAIEQMASRIVQVSAEFQPVTAAATSSASAAPASGCTVLFRVVGPDMQPVQNYTVAIAGTDKSAEIKDGVLRFSYAGDQPVIQVNITKAPAGVQPKPVYAGKIDGACDNKTERVFALELQTSGEGTFSWWQ
jgi:hypothetical protein